MSFPRYPKYKPSGVEWLGDVPEHWVIVPLRYAFHNLDHKRIPLAGEDRADVEKHYPYYGASGIIDHVADYLFDETLILVAEDGANLLSRSTPIAFVATGKYWVNNHAHILKPIDGNTTFWESLLQSYDYSPIVTGAAQPKLTADRLGSIRLPKPPPGEQTKIALFLDQETSKIDSLVAEQRRLIELLKEKRQAVISHAVTKGLNPHAPLKPSGIQWLSDVPEHWGVMRVKHVIRTIEQGWSPQCEGFPVETDNEWGVLKVGCVNGGIFDRNENKVLPANLDPIPELAISSGDLLISRANTRELVGSAAVAETDFPKLMLCDKLYRLRVKPGVASPMFLSFYLGSDAARGPIELGATGASASMVNIGQSIILELELPAPPIAEQESIVSTLVCEAAKFDALTAEAERAIELLQERRTALISAAVTGKIDVRSVIEREAA